MGIDCYCLSKLAMNAKDVGLAQEDIGRLTETISKGIALSGATAAQADAAIMQLGQALGSGALRGMNSTQ